MPKTITSVSDAGKLVRVHRKLRSLTLEKVSGICHLSMRFLSEFERGKATVEFGKVLTLLNKLGLEVIIQPRGTQERLLNNQKHEDE